MRRQGLLLSGYDYTMISHAERPLVWGIILMESRILSELGLWIYLVGIIAVILTDERRPVFNMVRGSWAVANGKGEQSTHSCLLTVDEMQAPASCSCCLVFPATTDCTLHRAKSRKRAFSLQCFCQSILLQQHEQKFDKNACVKSNVPKSYWAGCTLQRLVLGTQIQCSGKKNQAHSLKAWHKPHALAPCGLFCWSGKRSSYKEQSLSTNLECPPRHLELRSQSQELLIG